MATPPLGRGHGICDAPDIARVLAALGWVPCCADERRAGLRIA